MREDGQRFFVITGGPGSGKSALIEAIQRSGYVTSVEAGRGIIRDQVAIGGNALEGPALIRGNDAVLGDAFLPYGGV